MQDFKQGEMVHARNSGWKEGEFLKLPFVVKYKDNFWCESGDGSIVMFDFVNHIPKPKMAPFTFDTFPIGLVFIRKPGSRGRAVTGVCKNEISFVTTSINTVDYFNLLKSYEISTDNCETWHPAGLHCKTSPAYEGLQEFAPVEIEIAMEEGPAGQEVTE